MTDIQNDLLMKHNINQQNLELTKIK